MKRERLMLKRPSGWFAAGRRSHRVSDSGKLLGTASAKSGADGTTLAANCGQRSDTGRISLAMSKVGCPFGCPTSPESCPTSPECNVPVLPARGNEMMLIKPYLQKILDSCGALRQS